VAVTETDICNRALQRIGAQRIADMDTDTTDPGTACASAYDHIRDEVLRSHPWNCAIERANVVGKQTISGITNANPGIVQFNWAPHAWVAGDLITIAGATGMSDSINTTHTVGVANPGTFTLSGLDTTSYGTYDAYSATCSYAASSWPDDDAIRYKLPDDCLRVLGLRDSDGINWSREVWTVEGNFLVTRAGAVTQNATVTSLYKTSIQFSYIKQLTDPDFYDPLLVSAVASRLAVELCEVLTQSNTKRELAQREYQQLLMDARRADGQEQSPTPLAEDDWILARY